MKQTAAEFVVTFAELGEEAQREKAHAIAERMAPGLAETSAEKAGAIAIGVRLALLGKPLPETCSKFWRKGFALGRAIRDGQLPP